MLKKKGIYIEKIPYGNAYTVIYYDGIHLLIIPINNGVEPNLYIKYSGTTFIDDSHKRVTLSSIIKSYCPFGINFICDNLNDFPLIDIKTILDKMLIEGND